MGRFSSVVVLLLAACGDNLDEEGGAPLPIDQVDVTGSETGDQVPAPRYAPSVCGVQMWTTTIAGTPAMNVSAASHATGVTVLATPREGGSLTGFELDTRMDMLAQDKIAIDGSFTHVVASYVNGRLVSSAIQDGSVFVHLLDPNLANPQQTAKLPGKVIAEPAFAFTSSDIVMPVGGDDGLSLHRFNGSFVVTDSKLVVPSGPVRAMTAAQLDGGTMIGWSTDTACHMMRTNTFGGGSDTRMAGACSEPRIATNPQTGDGVMVFETAGAVRMTSFSATSFGGASTIVRPDSSAARVAFDGNRFWVSYLDVRGDVIVGIVDSEQRVTSMSLAGPKPEPGAYELVIANGEPWLFTLGTEGYAAYRMCAVAQ